jgi:predicted PurR-regulated permease PerM
MPQDVAPPEHPFDSSGKLGPLLSTLLAIPLKKLAIWAGFGLLLYILRDFFPLLFLTFVLSYITSSITSKIEHRFSHRWVPVTVLFLILVGGLAGFSWGTVPQIRKSARDVNQQVKDAGNWNRFIDAKLENALGKKGYDSWVDELGDHEEARAVEGAPSAAPHVPSLSRAVIGHLPKDTVNEYFGLLLGVGKAFWKGVAFLFMSIIFSYLFVLSLPRFKKGVRQLEQSRVSEIYLEVAPSVIQFGRLVGRALEAQTIIAIVNTAITAAGMSILGIPQIWLLSVGVFVCSFIPVAGVWISTAPIALIAVLMSPEQGGGMGKLIGVIVMVVIAHIVEAYILNPKIYGHHMKMNPLAVLFILVIAENLVGIWGLVVAVPLMTYVWKHMILGEPGENDVPPPKDLAPAPPLAVEAPPSPQASVAVGPPG